jgi:4-amino-4-deoxy-L-arabinose transferase-like glycosyltransferase
MISFWKKYATNYFFLLIIFIVSTLIFLPNLNRHFLWQDEAQTALISKSILTNGIPHSHDDKNSFSQELGAENGAGGVYKWHPWIPFYIHAIFFYFFGQSDFVARLPDALFGIGTVLLCFWTMRSTGWGTRASLLAAGILMLMIPFLLLSRQCRYYSMAAFFSTGCILSYFLFLQSKRNARLLLMCSTVFLFHVQMIYAAVFLITVLFHMILAGKEFFKRILAPIIGILCFVMPWLIYISEISFMSRYSHFVHNPYLTKRLFFDFISDLESYVIPLYFLAFLLAILIWHRKNLHNLWSNTKLYTSFYFIYLEIFLITLSFTAPYSLFRYLSPVLPICAIVAAEIVELGFQANPLVGCIGLFVVFLHQPLSDYYFELTHDFKGPMEGLVGHMKRYAQPTDTIAITYGDMPLKWYTNLRVIGGLSGDNLEGARYARWVIIRKYAISIKDLVVANNLYSQMLGKQYRKLIIDAPDTPYENREDPKEHLYRTATEEDSVVIYERIP